METIHEIDAPCNTGPDVFTRQLCSMIQSLEREWRTVVIRNPVFAAMPHKHLLRQAHVALVELREFSEVAP